MTYKELNVNCNIKEEYLITIKDVGCFDYPNCGKRLSTELKEIADYSNLEHNNDILSKY